MAPRPKLPPAVELLKLEKRGYTDAEVGEMFGVTRAAVTKAKRAAGAPSRRPPRVESGGIIPWVISVDHRKHLIYKRLQAYSRSVQGAPVADQKVLDNWLLFMAGGNDTGLPLVVCYDRNDVDGFWYEPRRSDETGLIRE